MYTNDTNFVSSGLSRGGAGLGFGGDGGSLAAILLLAVLGGGRRGGLFGGGDDCCDKQLVVDAINGRVDAVKEIASHLHTDVDNIQMALCDVKARLEANGVKIDCVKEKLHDTHIDLKHLASEFCNFKADARVALKDLEIRALVDKAEVLKKVECVEDKVAKEFCKLREEQKDEVIRQLRCERDKQDASISNINFGTQITTLTNLVTALASKVG